MSQQQQSSEPHTSKITDKPDTEIAYSLLDRRIPIGLGIADAVTAVAVIAVAVIAVAVIALARGVQISTIVTRSALHRSLTILLLSVAILLPSCMLGSVPAVGTITGLIFMGAAMNRGLVKPLPSVIAHVRGLAVRPERHLLVAVDIIICGRPTVCVTLIQRIIVGVLIVAGVRR
jgi:hypothetical protein